MSRTVRRRTRRAGAKRAASLAIETRVLTPSLWSDLERLFGKNGACAGCWCMWWRLEEGEDFMDVHGASAKKRFKALVTSGAAHGVLAYAAGEPIGWCSFDRRSDFVRLDRAPSLALKDGESADGVWSVPCFFIKAGFRGKGVGKALLAAALVQMKKSGATIAESYPVKVGRGARVGNGGAFTGVPALFESQDFELVQIRPRGRQRMRKEL